MEVVTFGCNYFKVVNYFSTTTETLVQVQIQFYWYNLTTALVFPAITMIQLYTTMQTQTRFLN